MIDALVLLAALAGPPKQPTVAIKKFVPAMVVTVCNPVGCHLRVLLIEVSVPPAVREKIIIQHKRRKVTPP